MRLATPLILACGLSAAALAPALAQDRPPALLIHGNYCGPGNNAPLPPIDALDAACARTMPARPAAGWPRRPATPACSGRRA